MRERHENVVPWRNDMKEFKIDMRASRERCDVRNRMSDMNMMDMLDMMELLSIALHRIFGLLAIHLER